MTYSKNICKLLFGKKGYINVWDGSKYVIFVPCDKNR